jgi:hypothetical protein
MEREREAQNHTDVEASNPEKEREKTNNLRGKSKPTIHLQRITTGGNSGTRWGTS